MMNGADGWIVIKMTEDETWLEGTFSQGRCGKCYFWAAQVQEITWGIVSVSGVSER